MILLRQVSKAYSPLNPVLQNIDLNLKRGDFLFVVGESGAGKTTLLKMITGEEKPSLGEASYQQYSLSANIRAIRNLHKRMGVVYQDYRLLLDKSVFENIAIPLHFGRAGSGVSKVGFFGKRAKTLVEDALMAVSLPKSIMDAKVKELSGGEQQRVSIARAIINFPDILIADEPTSNLDHEHTWVIMDLFQQLNKKGMTIVIATHDQDIVRKVRKRACHLRDGRLQFDERGGVCIF